MTESEASFNARGPAPVSRPPAEGKAPLTLEYVDGRPVLRATEGSVVPLTIPVVDTTGKSLARFVAGTDIEDDGSSGVHIQWQLPESLATGYYAQDDGSVVFPLIPNR